MLMEQKGACDSMIDEKNKLIHDFQQVLIVCLLFELAMIFFLVENHTTVLFINIVVLTLFKPFNSTL